MASKQSTVDYILEQMAEAGDVSAKKMFGEYGIFYNGKMVAVVCDDQLFVKPTEAGKAFIAKYEEASPFPGAKPYLRIAGDKWDDREWLAQLIRLTANELPVPKTPKKAKKKTKATP